MSYYGYKPYVSVAARRLKAEKLAAKAKKSGAEFTPVEAFRGGIAKTFWGKAWCDNLEHYSDFANRLPRGRSYVRNGSVVDLKVTAGEVHAKVMGSSLYAVEIKMTAVAAKQWQTLGAECSGSIDSLVELLQGKLSKAVMERICKPSSGLFPSPKDIHFKCSCPDWASMCKHVAAVFYGIGARLDQQPALLFTYVVSTPATWSHKQRCDSLVQLVFFPIWIFKRYGPVNGIAQIAMAFHQVRPGWRVGIFKIRHWKLQGL